VKSFSEYLNEGVFSSKDEKLLKKRGWKKFLSAWYLYLEYGDEPHTVAEAIKKEKWKDKNGYYLMGNNRGLGKSK